MLIPTDTKGERKRADNLGVAQTNLKMADFLLEENFFEEILTNPGYFGIWHRILGYLDFQTLLRCQQVSKNFKRSILSSQQFWTLQHRYFDKKLEFFQIFEDIDSKELEDTAKESMIATLRKSPTLNQALHQWRECNERVLPKYWEAQWTREGRMYYANHKATSTQRQHPLPLQVRLPLPPGWKIMLTKQKYFLFVNGTKGLCSWKHPTQIKKNERTKQLVHFLTDDSTGYGEEIDGTIYFTSLQFNNFGRIKPKVIRKWYHPGLIKAMQDSVPNGWEVREDTRGRIFYINQTDRSTSWYHPSELGRIHESNLRIRPFSLLALGEERF